MKDTPLEDSAQSVRESLQRHRLEALATLALLTGMRRDELLHLTWAEVDLEQGELHILNAKTKRNVRVITLSQEVAQMLRDHQLRQMEQGREAERADPRSDLVFPDDTGGVFNPQRFGEVWHTLLEHAGFPLLRFHELRMLVWRRLLEQVRTSRESKQNTSIDE